MKTLLHASAGVFALLMLIAYFLAMVFAKALYATEDMITVQKAMLESMWAYIPLILIAGSIGLVLGNERKGLIVEAKKRRMFLVVLFSVFALLPSNYLLANNILIAEEAIVLFVMEAFESVVELILIILLILNFDYQQMNEVMMIIKQYNCSVVDQVAQLFVELKVGIPKNRLTEVIAKIDDLQGVTYTTSLVE